MSISLSIYIHTYNVCGVRSSLMRFRLAMSPTFVLITFSANLAASGSGGGSSSSSSSSCCCSSGGGAGAGDISSSSSSSSNNYIINTCSVGAQGRRGPQRGGPEAREACGHKVFG